MFNSNLTDILILAAFIIPLFAVGFGIPGILLYENFFRPYTMQKLASKFNLSYLKGSTNLLSYTSKKNIISGKIGNNSVMIYDTTAIPKTSTVKSFIWHGLILSSWGAPATARRQTICSINGIEKELTGFISGYYPVSKLQSLLSSIQ